MEGSDGFALRPAHRNWHTFVSSIKKRFLSSQEAQEALHQLYAEKYSGDIEDFIMRIKTLNNLVHMTGIPFRRGTTVNSHHATPPLAISRPRPRPRLAGRGYHGRKK